MAHNWFAVKVADQTVVDTSDHELPMGSTIDRWVYLCKRCDQVIISHEKPDPDVQEYDLHKPSLSRAGVITARIVDCDEMILGYVMDT